MAATREALLRLLADGGFHSGEALGEALGVSRAGVWKHVEALEKLGLDVFRVRGKGYRLGRPLELLDARRIAAGSNFRIERLQVFDSIDSTNAELMRANDAPGTVAACFAEHQDAGRGRRGRAWVSPFGSNLYFSLSWPFEQLPPDFAALSLAMGVGARRALNLLGVEGVGLKWPNDIYLGGRKLGGILLEMRGEPPGACRVVAGIGINVAMPERGGEQIDQAWTDLARAGYSLSRNRLAATLLDEWCRVLSEFADHGFSAFVTEWREADILAGHAVTVHDRDTEWQGEALGVTTDGALEIDVAGERRRVVVGDVTLRKVIR